RSAVFVSKTVRTRGLSTYWYRPTSFPSLACCVFWLNDEFTMAAPATTPATESKTDFPADCQDFMFPPSLKHEKCHDPSWLDTSGGWIRRPLPAPCRVTG